MKLMEKRIFKMNINKDRSVDSRFMNPMERLTHKYGATLLGKCSKDLEADYILENCMRVAFFDMGVTRDDDLGGRRNIVHNNLVKSATCDALAVMQGYPVTDLQVLSLDVILKKIAGQLPDYNEILFDNLEGIRGVRIDDLSVTYRETMYEGELNDGDMYTYDNIRECLVCIPTVDQLYDFKMVKLSYDVPMLLCN